jgi:enoyl-CoA hydratase
MKHETLNVTVEQSVARVELNRPHKRNAINRRMWDEVREAFRDLGEMPEVRVARAETDQNSWDDGIDGLR